MLDNLRDQASSSSLFRQEEEPPSDLPKQPKPKKSKRKSNKSIGISPFQRFILTFMLFMMVLLGGAGLLLITGKVIPPFLSLP